MFIYCIASFNFTPTPKSLDEYWTHWRSLKSRQTQNILNSADKLRTVLVAVVYLFALWGKTRASISLMLTVKSNNHGAHSGAMQSIDFKWYTEHFMNNWRFLLAGLACASLNSREQTLKLENGIWCFINTFWHRFAHRSSLFTIFSH